MVPPAQWLTCPGLRQLSPSRIAPPRDRIIQINQEQNRSSVTPNGVIIIDRGTDRVRRVAPGGMVDRLIDFLNDSVGFTFAGDGPFCALWHQY